MTKNNKLSGLSGSTEPQPATKARASGPIFVVRQTFADPGHRYSHTGPSVMQAGAGFVSVLPGLNILDEGTELDIAKLTGYRKTDDTLAGFTGAGDLRELAEQTEQPRALEHMLTIALAKPFTGNGRRDPELIALLQKRLTIASNVRHLDVGDLHVQASQQSMIAQSRAS